MTRPALAYVEVLADEQGVTVRPFSGAPWRGSGGTAFGSAGS